MPYLLLPRLSVATPIAAVAAGQWEDNPGLAGGNFLKGLSSSLVVAKNSKDIDNIDSIPDIWARPILFRMALFASRGFDTGLHEKVIGEWRALLAMIALQDTRHLNLTVDAVHLNQSDQLGQTFSMLAPQDSISNNGHAAKSDWNDIYIISYNKVPLAITSPTTLIMPAADYSNTLAGQLTVPWSVDGRHLIDPIPHLMPNELGGLHLWLNNLKQDLLKNIPPAVRINNDTCQQLFPILDNYIQDVFRQANGVFPAVGGLVPAGMNMFIGTSAFLDKKVQPPPSNPKDSAVLLRTNDARADSKPLLLVSTKMLQELAVSRGLSPAQIVIWPGITAADFREEYLTNDKTMINGVSIDGAEWRRPEDFFTDRLVIHAGGNALKGILKVPGSDILSKDDMSVILPLRSEILNYFTPQEITRNFRIEKAGSDIKVQFTFPISGINNTGAEYRAEKSYPMQGVTYLTKNVPVIEIWPNFKRPSWKKYYLYYENSEAQNKTQEAGSGFLYVYPWGYGDNIAGDTPRHGLANLYTARLSGFPEALICTATLASSGEVYAGLILLDEPEQVQTMMGKSWQVGIDFGTSSTMLFYRDGNATPKPLVLQSNLFDVTDSPMLNRTYQNFIPSSTETHQDGSFQSIFQLLNGSHLRDSPPNIYPLQDGNIYWVLGANDDYFRTNIGQIDTNLKWGTNVVSQLKVSAYIKQICLQSLAEAAKKCVGDISWNFSYPTAFSSAKTMTFSATCQDAVNEAIKDSGFDIAPVLQAPEYWSESKANAYYFSKLGGVHFAGGAVCLDIGAGTTDISVISGHPARIVYHTSLQFAGRYLFQSIYKHYDIFASTLNLNGMEAEPRDALIDADMRKNSKKYQDGLKNMIVKNDVQKVLQLAQFALAGIFYYIGGMVNLLHERGIYQGDSLPDIYVGGNGSRIFPWICGGTFTTHNPYIEVFKDMLVATSGLSAVDFKIILSDTPKVEVARGMTEDRPHNDEIFYNQRQIATDIFGEEKGRDPLIANSVFAGDNFIVGSQLSKKTEFISAYEIAEGVSIRNVDELRTFTTKFNESPNIWAQRINISDQQFARVTRTVQGAYASQVARDPQDIFVEPVFILEMKGAMSLF